MGTLVKEFERRAKNMEERRKKIEKETTEGTKSE